MRLKLSWWLPGVLAVAALLCAGPAAAQVYTQCPSPLPASARCIHLAAGDGFVLMADGWPQYIFGFQQIPAGTPDSRVMRLAELGAEYPAPTLVMDEGTQVYLNLSNVGMPMRPDLFDAHSIHFHGFPQAAPVFDGLPESSVTIKMGATFTYFYNLVEPGTYLYHCHVEATEHMQMGMLGNLYVRPKQDCDGSVLPKAARCGGSVGGYAYNDGDGSTRYDVEATLQVSGFDRIYHDKHIAVQPLPFAAMRDTDAMMNGRGYPDTIVEGTIPAPTTADSGGKDWTKDPFKRTGPQRVTSRITAGPNQRILLRLSNVSVQAFYTIASPSIPMQVVGVNARLLRGPDPDGAGPARGADLYYTTHSVNLGGGESMDIILDTAGLAPGTYFLYTSNLNYLSNYEQDLGGAMTEIVIGG